MQLSVWSSAETKNRWKYFYSIEQERIYKRERHSWKVFSKVPGPNLLRKRYIEVTEVNPTITWELDHSANQIATMKHEHVGIILEDHHAFISQNDQKESQEIDPYTNNFNSLKDAFDALCQCNRVLLDYYQLPQDDYEAIIEAIKTGKLVQLATVCTDR